MHAQLIYLFFALILSALLYPYWIGFVYKYHMGEEIRSDGPQTHLAKKGTPTMGGLVLLLVVALVTFLLNRSRDQTLFPLFVAGLAGLFGLIEDFSKIYKDTGLSLYFEIPLIRKFVKFRLFVKLSQSASKFLSIPWKLFVEFWRIVGSRSDHGLQTYQKFFIQSLIGGFVAYWTYFKLGWDYFWFPLIGNVHFGFLYPIIIFFLFIAVLNFVAFTDGIDGLAGGLSLIALLAIWVVASFLEYNSLAAYTATFIGALMPFLYFNINPARIFMGNVGSHVLGASLLVLGIVMHREIAVLVILMVFLVDGVSSPIQQIIFRFTNKRILLMAPLHHHFELLGWKEAKVAMRFWLFGGLFAFIGVFVALL